MTLKTLESLMRPEILRMTPYVPIKPFHVLSQELGIPQDKIIKLDANENPYGASPKAIQALQCLAAETPIYPDPASGDLRKRLARELGVTSDQVVVGAGADELIELLFKLFVAPGEAIINCPPTFGMYTFCAAIAGAKEIIVERDENYQLDGEAIEAAALEHRPKLILLCAPNNPDGGYIAPGIMERLLRLDAIVVLDEAYVAFVEPDLQAEFGEGNSGRLVAQHPNLVVLRTFSKWAGMAGLRCGYGIFAPEIARFLMTIKQPYNVNVAARAAALASLDDLDILKTRVNAMLVERDRLYNALAGLDYLKPVPNSRANFILVEVLDRPAKELKAALDQRGVMVRYFAKSRLDNHIRISLGTPEQTGILIDTLKELA
jgi:histidinol-phosphate aminotransferase